MTCAPKKYRDRIFSILAFVEIVYHLTILATPNYVLRAYKYRDRIFSIPVFVQIVYLLTMLAISALELLFGLSVTHHGWRHVQGR